MALPCTYPARKARRPVRSIGQNEFLSFTSRGDQAPTSTGVATPKSSDLSIDQNIRPSPNVSCDVSELGDGVLPNLSPAHRSPRPAISAEPTLADLQSAWFLTPESWETVGLLGTLPNRHITSRMLEEWACVIQGWLADWSTHGANVFVHHQLYASEVPPCIRDAFTTLASYHHRSSSTENMVFRIIGARITELARGEAEKVQASSSAAESDCLQEVELDVLGHLSRVHALFAYVTIGLFHGNIRLRHVAESHLNLLVSWSQQMLRATARAAGSGQLLLSQAKKAPRLGIYMLNPEEQQQPSEMTLPLIWRQLGLAEQEETLLHTWVLAESVRRAWLAARGVESIYRILRDEEIICPGGLMFTTRKGLWDADSAFTWANICAESDPGFLHIGMTDKLCLNSSPEDLDEFAKVIIKMNYRTERTRLWMANG